MIGVELVDLEFRHAQSVGRAVGAQRHANGFVELKGSAMRLIGTATVPVVDVVVVEVRVAEVDEIAGSTNTPRGVPRFRDHFGLSRTLMRGDESPTILFVDSAAKLRFEVDIRIERGLFDIRKSARVPRIGVGQVGVISPPGVRAADLHTDRETALVGVGVHLAREGQLLEVVRALHAASGFARGLNRRQKQADQNTDNRDHDEELDEREAATLGVWVKSHHLKNLYSI